QEQDVADELLVATEQLLERCRLGAVVELRVAEEPTQLRHLALRLDEVTELFADGVEPVVIPRRLEEGARVHAVRYRHLVVSLQDAEVEFPDRLVDQTALVL